MPVRASSWWAPRLLFSTLLLPLQLEAQPVERAAGASSSKPTVAEIVPPKPLATPLNYPEGVSGSAASGSHTVELVLTIDANGHVVDVRVLDHIIVGEGDPLSMAEYGWM